MIEASFRTFVQRTPSLIFTMTPGGSIEFVNARWSEVIAADAESMLGLGWQRYVYPHDLASLLGSLRAHADGSRPYVAEWRLKRADDADRWVEIRAEAHVDASGRVVRWYGAGIDIDSKRRAIDALDLLAQSGATAGTAADVDTTLERVALASLSGLADISLFDLVESDGSTRRVVIGADRAPSEAVDLIRSLSTPPLDGAHPVARAIREGISYHVPIVDEAYVARSIETVRSDAWRRSGIRSLVCAPMLALGETLGALTLLRTRMGAPFDVRDVRVVEEIASRTAVAIENIRLRERARRTTLEREERFHRIADAIPQLMWIADIGGNVEWVNARWLDFTGQTAHDAIASGWRAIVHPGDVERTDATWRAAGDVAATYECEFRLRAKDGAYRWFLGRATPVPTENGLKWYGTNTDVDDARRAARTMRVFADVGKALSESLGLQATLEAVMQFAVPDYADWAFVTLADESHDLYLAAIYHADEAVSARLRTLVGKLYARGDRDSGSPAAVRSGEPLLYTHATREDAARVVEPDVADVMWETIGFTSVLVVPLVVGLTVRGALTICMAQSQRTIDPVDLPFFTELGRRIAPAIANAEIFERERRVAKSFQEAALPASLPIVDGYIFSAIYEAGRMEALVGGDWYDAFKLLDGRIVVSIGDVAGSGLRAAVTMANIRQAIRGVAHVHADPELMLEAADRALRTENPESFATAFVGVIDPVSATMSYRSAGHPAALVSSRANGIVELRTGGLPLGLRDTVRAPADVAHLPVGSVLYLYTDGLTESTHDMLEGERRLVEAIGATERTPPATRAEALYDSILVDGSRDDVAILTVSVMGRPEPQRWTIDARVPAVADRVRAEVIAALRIGRDAPDASLAVEIILAEIVGNLLRYAPDEAEIVLDWDDERPVMHVLDRGPGFEFLPKLPPDVFSESGRGLFLISSLAADFNVTRRIDGGSHARVVFAV